MNRQIWKFPIAIRDEQSLLMPRGSEILSVQEQKGLICVWALADIDAPFEKRLIRIYGTGHPIEGEPGEFIATVQTDGGNLMRHIFEVKS
jgi:hypothetical protein